MVCDRWLCCYSHATSTRRPQCSPREQGRQKNNAEKGRTPPKTQSNGDVDYRYTTGHEQRLLLVHTAVVQLTCGNIESERLRLYPFVNPPVHLAEARQPRRAHPHDEVLIQNAFDRVDDVRVRLVQELGLQRKPGVVRFGGGWEGGGGRTGGVGGGMGGGRARTGGREEGGGGGGHTSQEVESLATPIVAE